MDVENSQAKDFPMPSTSYMVAPTDPDAPTFTDGPSTTTTTTNYTSFVRFCMYVFFTFYLIFALLILFTGRVDLVHKEHLMSQVVHLDMEEINIQRMFILNALFLSVAATLGLFSFYHHKYSLFLSFSLGLLFTIIFSMVSFKYSFTAYSRMGDMLSNHTSIDAIFGAQMTHYDWLDISDEKSAFVNKFQAEFNCCGGSKGYKDWESLKPASLPNGAFPLSCCVVHFSADMSINWCSYQDVENMRSCPAAFTSHLISVQNTLKTQMMLLFEICLTQFLTIAVFFFLIFRGERMFSMARK